MTKTARSSSKRKQETITHTIRPLAYTYIHLSLSHPPSPTSSTPPAALDILTAHTALQSALTRFLGLHGSAIAIDILHVTTAAAPAEREGKVGGGSQMGEFWIRVPREDGDQVVAAVSGWVGREGQVLRVRGRGEWLGGLVGGLRDEVWG